MNRILVGSFFILLFTSTIPLCAQAPDAGEGVAVGGCHGCPEPSTSENTSTYDPYAAQRQQQELERQKQVEAERKQKLREKKRREQEMFNAEKNEALHDLKGVSAGDDTGLKGTDSDNSDLGLKDTDSDLKDAPHAEKSIQKSEIKIKNIVNAGVVDARGAEIPMMRQAEEIENSPANREARKGFQAIGDHDWKVARAWYQQALLKDPGNKALERMVDLCQFTLDHQQKEKDEKNILGLWKEKGPTPSDPGSVSKVIQLLEKSPGKGVPEEAMKKLWKILDASYDQWVAETVQKDLAHFNSENPDQIFSSLITEEILKMRKTPGKDITPKLIKKLDQDLLEVTVRDANEVVAREAENRAVDFIAANKFKEAKEELRSAAELAPWVKNYKIAADSLDRRTAGK